MNETFRAFVLFGMWAAVRYVNRMGEIIKKLSPKTKVLADMCSGSLSWLHRTNAHGLLWYNMPHVDGVMLHVNPYVEGALAYLNDWARRLHARGKELWVWVGYALRAIHNRKRWAFACYVAMAKLFGADGLKIYDWQILTRKKPYGEAMRRFLPQALGAWRAMGKPVLPKIGVYYGWGSQFAALAEQKAVQRADAFAALSWARSLREIFAPYVHPCTLFRLEDAIHYPVNILRFDADPESRELWHEEAGALLQLGKEVCLLVMFLVDFVLTGLG